MNLKMIIILSRNLSSSSSVASLFPERNLESTYFAGKEKKGRALYYTIVTNYVKQK